MELPVFRLPVCPLACVLFNNENEGGNLYPTCRYWSGRVVRKEVKLKTPEGQGDGRIKKKKRKTKPLSSAVWSLWSILRSLFLLRQFDEVIMDRRRFSGAIKSRRSEVTDSAGMDPGQPLVEPWRLITPGDPPRESLFRCLLAPSLGCFQAAFKGTDSLYPAFGEFRAICTVSGVELLFANKTMPLFQPSSCVNSLLPTLMSVGRFLLFYLFHLMQRLKNWAEEQKENWFFSPQNNEAWH